MEPPSGTRPGMLVLNRYPLESLRISDDITITVLGVQGDQVRLGIDAPSYVGIHREEIYRRIQVGNIAATDTPSPPVVIIRRTRIRQSE